MKTAVRQVLTAFIALVVLVTLTERSARAAGTPAGVTIANPATATYDVSGIPQLPITALTSFVVDRKINLIVTTTNGVYVGVNPGAAAQVLTFTVTNVGNSAQDFALAAVHGADPFGGTDNFNAANVRVFVESGVTAGYQAAEDTGTYLDELAADAVRTVYIVADIPGGQVSGDISALSLIATARSGGGAGVLGGAVSETVGPNTQGVVDTVFADAAGVVDGVRDGAHSAASAYRVASAAVTLLKSAVVTSAGNQPVTGATIRYTIVVTVSGSGTAVGVVISDPVPVNTTYASGTLRLNNILLTDAADADAGDVNATTAGTVTVKLGDLNSASPVQTITFDVKIN